jgi:PBP1b-binding outer membrane lipoprotein LpoB
MKKLTLILGLILLAGCNPKKSSVKSATTTNADVTSLTSCTTASSNMVGSIYDTSNTAFSFNDRVRALLSATMSPTDVGFISYNISDPTGVRFSGKIKLDSSGNVVQAQSQLAITVYDSKWLNEGAQEIKIEFNPNNQGTVISGQVSSSGGANSFISFKDSYGEIRFENVIANADNLSGTVRFQNSANFSGGQPAGGTLGQLFIQRCAFLQ